jgi:hypothetical protein
MGVPDFSLLPRLAPQPPGASMPWVGGPVCVRAKAAGFRIALPLAGGRVVRGRRAGRALSQRFDLKPRAPQQRPKLVGGEADQIARLTVGDLHLDRGDARLEVRDAVGGQVTLEVGRPRVEVIAVAARQLEHDRLVGRGVQGSRVPRRHNPISISSFSADTPGAAHAARSASSRSAQVRTRPRKVT